MEIMEINWIDLIIKVALFLIGSYLVFYQSWLKFLGREIAQLSTRTQLTQLEEDVKKEFNEKLEDYKIKLNEELTLKIEPLKSDLAKNNILYQIQYSHLHQERAKVTLNIYQKLQELHSSMVDWTTSLQPIIEDAEKESEERRNRVNNAISDFRDYYILNKLFFSKGFCNYIDEIFKEYWDKGWEFGWNEDRLKSRDLPAGYIEEYSKEMMKISKEIRAKLPEKIIEIEDQCRKILGVEEE